MAIVNESRVIADTSIRFAIIGRRFVIANNNANARASRATRGLKRFYFDTKIDSRVSRKCKLHVIVKRKIFPFLIIDYLADTHETGQFHFREKFSSCSESNTLLGVLISYTCLLAKLLLIERDLNFSSES